MTLFHRALGYWGAIALLFEPRDLWIGVYWRSDWEGPTRMLTLYICILPMLPIRFSIKTGGAV